MPKTKLNPNQFVHLHNHTHYSLLDGLQKIPEMLDRVSELGMEAVALTDHGTLSGSIEFYKQARSRNIKPIIGMETYVSPREHTDKDGKKDANPYHLILLAMNNQGYENLMRLSTIAHLEGFYYKPRIDHTLLEKYNSGLMVLSGCIGGEVGDALRKNLDDDAREVALWYQSIFGDRYYLELQDHGHQWAEQGRVNAKLLTLSQELDIPAVVTSDAHYCHPDDQESHEVLLCVQTGSQLSDDKRMSLKDTSLFVSDPLDIAKRWEENPELLTNTKSIADRCNVEVKLGGILIPKFDTPKGKTEKQYLDELAYQGLAWRYGGKTQADADKLSIAQVKKCVDEVKLKRLAYELEVINRMGFDGYFLIVSDFINWGKAQGIIFGPGRGSAAGSIVSYSLNITDLDPLAYDLLFERFLNPDRISMPDIDIDIQDTRRGEVIEYTIEKYGVDRVANIVTFGTMAAKNAIRDTARVLGVPYSDADRLSKMVPPPVQGRHIPLKNSLKDVPELKAEYKSNSQSRRVFDLAVRLEGTIRSHGVHAAGVVIAPDDIVKYTPLEMAQKGVVATQYSMNPIEELGLLKMDFLGLSNLTIIKNALRIINKIYNIDIDITNLPLDDKKTYELLCRGDTTGVFQFESAGMKRYMKKLQPDVFEDLIALAALYRPGPLSAGYTDDFVATKNGKRKVSYDHPKMKNALEPTYGVMVYQEQVMQIARDMCGFTGGQADTLRKAIGKKKADLMAKMKQEFVSGMVEHSQVKAKFAEDYWSKLEGFADYCFNKSHSACYALIAYQTAYLKAHFPAAYMAALMTSDFENSDRIAIEISECRHMGIEVLPTDVNESYVEFSVHGDVIRFGLSAIKNVGVSAVEEILRARAEKKFDSIEDFAKRVSTKSVNRKAWESLIKAGAFDSLGDRGTLLHNLDSIVGFAQRLQKDARNGQTDLFGDSVIDVSMQPKLNLEEPAEVATEREQLQWERELLGVYLSSHPLDSYEGYFADKVMSIEKIMRDKEGAKVQIGGLVISLREITTRNGSQMAFVKMEDKSGELEVIVFPKTYEAFRDNWALDKVLLVQGTVSTKDRDGKVGGEVKILADKVIELGDKELHLPIDKPPVIETTDELSSTVSDDTAKDNDTGSGATETLQIFLPRSCSPETLLEIKQILNQNNGTSKAVIVIDKQQIKLPFLININSELTTNLAKLSNVDKVTIAQE